jgi:hypothetical protein
MNRKEEYGYLLAELNHTPPALEHAVTRAKARAKKTKHIHHFFTIPISSIAAFFIAFVIMVNVSTPVAMACGRIPLLRELAAVVAFSPSLSAAIKNEYIQPIELEQTENGITMRVEYVIVDQKQLNIFYSLQSAAYSNMDVVPSISNRDGTDMEDYSVLTSCFDTPNGELRQITIDFVGGDVPGELLLLCEVHDKENNIERGPAPMERSQTEEYKEPDVISTFSFVLSFDPYYTSKGDVVALNQSFVLDGQHITAPDIEIYPTHIRLNLLDDETNTAWLQALTFYLENEHGERFEAMKHGIAATGSIDSPFMASHRLESSFFSESQRLTLYITDAVWLDKDMKRVKIDLANGIADKLPEGVKLKESLRDGNSWQLTFSGIERKEDGSYQLFGTKYFDEAGNEYEYSSWSTTTVGHFDEKTNEAKEAPGVFEVQFSLVEYPFDTVYLSPSFSRTVELSSPVAIKVK